MSQTEDMSDKKEAENEEAIPAEDLSAALSKQPSFLRTASILVGKLLIFLIGLTALISAALYFYVQQAGGLAAIVSARLSNDDLGLQAQVSDVVFAFDAEEWIVEARLVDLSVRLEQQELSLPSVAFQVGPSILSGGHVFGASLDGVSLELMQARDGIHLAGQWGRLLERFQRQSLGDGKATEGWISLLVSRRLHLEDSQLIIRKEDSDDRLAFTDVELVLELDHSATISFDGALALEGGDNTLIEIEGQSNILSAYTDLQTKITQFPSASLTPFLTGELLKLGQLGEIDGTVNLSFDKRIIQSAAGDFTARNGALPLSFARANNEPFAQFDGGFSYSFVDDYLVLQDIVIRLPDGRKLSYSGQVAGLHQPVQSFEGQLLIEELSIDSLLQEWPQQALPEVRSYMIESFSGGAFETLAVIFDGHFNSQTSRLTLSSLSLNGEIDDVRVKAGYGQYKEFVGTAKGRLSLDVAQGGQLRSAGLKLDVRDGFLILEDMPTPLDFATASGEIIFKGGQILVPGLNVDFGDGQSLTSHLTMSLNEDNEPLSGQIGLEVGSMSIERIKSLWPKNVGARTSAYLKENVKGGDVSDFTLAMALGFEDEAGERRPQLLSLETDMRISGASFRWLKSQDMLDNVSGQITLRDNVVSVLVDGAGNDEMQIDNAEFYINPAIKSSSVNRLLTLKLRGEAGAPHVAALLGAPEINLLQKIPVSLDEVAGDVRAAIHLTGMLAPDGKGSFDLVSADATWQDGTLPKIFRDFDLTDADMVISASPQELEITGSGALATIPGNFSLSNRQDGLQITGNLAPSSVLTDLLVAEFDQELTGMIGGRFTIDKPAGNNQLEVFSAIDLQAAGVNIPLLNWAKLPGEAGQASAAFRFDEGTLRSIESISVDAGGLRAKGQVLMSGAGALEQARLTDVSWPGNKLDMILVEPAEDGSLFVKGEGELLDLRAVRGGEGLSEGRHITFDLTSNRLLVDQDVDLYGQITGEVTKDGNGTATLQGALIIKDKPLLEQGTVNAFFGPDGEYLTAVGLIGGAEARLEFSPEEGEYPLLIITTQNAGRVLAGLGITDTIRSGRMVLLNEFIGDDFSDYNTTINLQEFNVIEAPAAVRAFSVLGLAGLYSLVEGDGTRFTRGEATIETRGDVHNITKMKASGGAVGITMLGTYNRATKQVDVSGNLVPVNQFSKIIGAVPLLGEILSGVDKSGLFSTQFNVKGDIADPETSVNAASVAPGLIRDLFSPNWLGRERERILGLDNGSAE